MILNSHTKPTTYLFITYIYCLITLLAGSGCKKFLDIKPPTNVNTNPHMIAELEQILNNVDLASPDYLVVDLMSDDVMLPDNLLNVYSGDFYIKAYQWWPTIWDSAESDPMYNRAYQMILQCNVILDRLPSAPDGSPAQKSTISAQAKINRAYYYFQLANLYGKGYNAATAAQDLAIPLVLKPDASLLPARATVSQVYAQILKDLQDAVSTADLPNFGSDIIHPGKAAAFALQARVYLFMANYEQALASANAALQIKSTVMDYNKFSLQNNDPSGGILNRPLTLINEASNPETFLARVNLDYTFFAKFLTVPYISNELMTLMGNNDLRFVYNFDQHSGAAYPTYFVYKNNSYNTMVFNYSIGVPEMLLIKAECLARMGDATSALMQLELIRKFRFKTADYVSLDNSGPDNALKQVLEERRKELFLHGGLRLFDLKRLNMDPRFSKEIVRISDTDGHSIVRIEPGSPAYLMPFAPQIIAANPSIIQNPR
jgi:tetratricopeptide (TPR) repeat protein